MTRLRSNSLEPPPGWRPPTASRAATSNRSSSPSSGFTPVRRFEQVKALRTRPHAVRFRISLDHYDEARHDACRGAGNYRKAMDMLLRLHQEGFAVSIARLRAADEDVAEVDRHFADRLAENGLPVDTPIISFPEFLRPGSMGHSPEITESCMTTHHTEESRSAFMCQYSKMVLKKEGRMRVYACTLVDDDEAYDLGDRLSESMKARVMLKHHRCFTCFAYGASCSEKGNKS